MQQTNYRASSLKFKYVSFEPRRFVEALEESTIGKLDLVTGTAAFTIC